MRNTFYDCIQYVINTLTCFSRCINDFLRFTTDKVNYFICHFLRHSVRHVYLIDDRDNLQVVVDSHIEVAYGLCLYSLSSIDNEQSSLASCNGTAHFIGEVHVSRSVNKVQDIFTLIHYIAIVIIFHLDGMTLDGDSTLLLKVHIVEHLSLSNLNGISLLKQSVCQSGFTMVDVSYNTEVTYIFHSLYYFSIFLNEGGMGVSNLRNSPVIGCWNANL